MQALVIAISRFGNTQQIACAIADGLAADASVQLMSLDDVQDADLEAPDLVIVGTPTHRMNLPKEVRPIVKAWPSHSLRGKAVVAFDTSYKMSPLLRQFTASKKMIRSLRKAGGRPIVPPETFHVVAREGPLHDGEVERARVWAGVILRKLGGRD